MGVVLVEVPLNSSGRTDGVARMPDALRAGLHEALPALDRVVAVDVGDLVPRRGPSGFLAEDALVRAVLGARWARRSPPAPCRSSWAATARCCSGRSRRSLPRATGRAWSS
jgi:hypothetical protein